MSVKVRPYRRGGWEVDVTVRLPNGSRWRERSKAPVSSKSAAIRCGEDRERHVLQHGVPQPKKEVPTLEAFAPRFLDGHSRANRQKPSGIVSKESILHQHLVPLLGSKKLDAITTEDVQNVKRHLKDRAPKTLNNVLTVLNTLLKKGSGVGRHRPDAVHDPAVARGEDFNAVPRLRPVRPAHRRCASTRSDDALGRSARWRSRVAMRRDRGAGVEGRRPAETAALRSAVGLEGSCDGSERRSIAIRAAHGSSGRGASRPPTSPISARTLSGRRCVPDAEDGLGSCAPCRAGRPSRE